MGFLDKPNNVAHWQKFFQSSHLPVYARGSRDRILVFFCYAGATTAVYQIAKGLFHMIRGSNKLES